MRCETIICKDGFSMSVQAGWALYSSPRLDNAEAYSEVEVGYPNRHEPLFDPYFIGNDLAHFDELQKEPWDDRQIYGYVPSMIVVLVCMKHGGIISGNLPSGIQYVTAELMEESDESV